jgi:ATP-dependent Lon protease
VKEQLNKRKADDEFAEIHLSYTNTLGEKVEVHCPESLGIDATLNPRRQQPAPESPQPAKPTAKPIIQPEAVSTAAAPTTNAIPQIGPMELKDKQFTIRYGDTGYSYRSIFGDYLIGAKKLVIQDPHIRREHQIGNLLQLCELAVEAGTIKTIELVTTAENPAQQADAEQKLDDLKENLADCDVAFSYRFADQAPEREIRTDTGWRIHMDRGLEIYQGPINRIRIGATNYDLRPCMETKVNILR